jgi:NAD(P)H-hydrate epimerase
MILSTAQMLDAEAKAFAEGQTAEELMEQAGSQLAALVRQFHPTPGTCRIFFGKGHNGGDVLVAARHLAAEGWRIVLEPVFPEASLSPLTATQLSRLPSSFVGQARPLVVLDGILGIGIKGDPREPVATAIHRINYLREHEAAWVLSADLPSGLRDDAPGDPCVKADVTMAMGFVKSCLVNDHATDFVGRLAVADLPALCAPPAADPAQILTPKILSLPPRSFDRHKGMSGRVAILAGSRCYPGAARLCSAAAVKAGAGLVTLIVPSDCVATLSASVIPEVMVWALDDFSVLLNEKWDAFGIGPGLGRERDEMICEFLRRCSAPCVVDADALNALSGQMDVVRENAGQRLLTPHHLEMERLSPCNGRDRLQWLADFVSQYPVTLLLKGARTLIGNINSPVAFNTTGHPGMASGGMGDVLTGVCAALIAQGRDITDSARLAAWVCGRAAELAIRENTVSQESLTASDVIAHLGGAFIDLRAGVF